MVVIAGKDKGKKGKVIKTLIAEERLVVEGINLRHRRVRPRKTGEKGQVVDVPQAIALSNVLLWCPACQRGTRLKTKVLGRKKIRLCAKCGQEK